MVWSLPHGCAERQYQRLLPLAVQLKAGPDLLAALSVRSAPVLVGELLCHQAQHVLGLRSRNRQDWFRLTSVRRMPSLPVPPRTSAALACPRMCCLPEPTSRRRSLWFGSVLHGRDTEESDLDNLIDPMPQTTLFDIGAIRLKGAAKKTENKAR